MQVREEPERLAYCAFLDRILAKPCTIHGLYTARRTVWIVQWYGYIPVCRSQKKKKSDRGVAMVGEGVRIV